MQNSPTRYDFCLLHLAQMCLLKGHAKSNDCKIPFSCVCLALNIGCLLYQGSGTGSEQSGGALKSLKEKFSQQDKDKDAKEGPNLQVAGPGGEITAGIMMR